MIILKKEPKIWVQNRNFKPLTYRFDQVRVSVERDQRNGNGSEIEFEHSGDHVHIIAFGQNLSGRRPIGFQFVFQVIDVVREAGHSVKSFGVQASVLDLLYAVLDDERPNGVIGLHEGGQIDAEHPADALWVRAAIVRYFLRTFLVRYEVAILAFHSLTENAE